jgi:hypothetical protein
VKFRDRYPGADTFRVTLYGSLGATGKGHLTDQAIQEARTPSRTLVAQWTDSGSRPAFVSGAAEGALFPEIISGSPNYKKREGMNGRSGDSAADRRGRFPIPYF